MIILVNNERFETMACAMAWAKLLGVNVEVHSDEWLERLRQEYISEALQLDGNFCEIDGVFCYSQQAAAEQLAKTRKYRPLGLYEVEA